MLVGCAHEIKSGPYCSKPGRQIENYVDDDLHEIQESCIESLKQYCLWKNKKPYSYCRANQKILYKDLNEDVQHLIREFAGIDPLMTECTKYYSPLQEAVKNRDGDRVQILLALGVDINLTPCECNRTPLYSTILCYDYAHQKRDEAKSYAIFRHLLAKGVDYNKPNEISSMVSFYCDYDYVRDTPLHLAVWRPKTIRLFLDLLKLPNINVHAKNRYGKTVLDKAKSNARCTTFFSPSERKCFYRMRALLEEAGASSSISTFQLMRSDSDEVMEREYQEYVRNRV